jgi:transcriptional regulator NrdR family protein
MFRPLNAPLCPKCGSNETRVLGKYTTQENDSVRDRICRDCNHRWRTLQSPEEVLDPSILVKFARWGSPQGSRRQVTLEYASKGR